MANYGMGHDEDSQKRMGDVPMPAPAAKRGISSGENEGMIHKELARIDENYEQLQDELSLLYDRLTPILGPDRPTDASTRPMSDSPERSQMLSKLIDHADRLEGVAYMVRYHRSRIEL